eukprot:5435987-Amphidinium_carterae.2
MQLKQWLGEEYLLCTSTPLRLYALDQKHWQTLPHYGFSCQALAMAHSWFSSITVCADAWYRDLEDMVPDAQTDAGNGAEHEWKLHHRQGHITKFYMPEGVGHQSGASAQE